MIIPALIKKVLYKPWLFILFLLLLPSCIALRQDFQYLNDQIMLLNTKVIRLQDTLKNELKAVRMRQAEAGSEIDSIKREIDKLSGQIEDSGYLVKHAIERDTGSQDFIKAALADLSKRTLALEEGIKQLQGYLDLKSPSIGEKQGPKKGTIKEKGPGYQPPGLGKKTVSPEEEFYNFTIATYNEGKYKVAIAGFKSFIKKYPQSGLADNAQFWIGESYMSLKQYEKAILAYQEVIKRYPKGNKVPNAMFRQALAFYELKDNTSAKLLFKKIIKNYPKSSEAKIAKIKLKAIK